MGKERGKEEKLRKNLCSVLLTDRRKMTEFSIVHERGKISELTETM